ncbi:MAG: aminotransferase class V-fold PLP-dependent enzyme [Flavobacteriales bacterium]|nr:aminotransferase class V-fold PLP-dependent enzyme [Flavobacteriales bacterium]
MGLITRKQFIQRSGMALMGAPVLSALAPLTSFSACSTDTDPLSMAADEAFWNSIRQLYTLDDKVINLNNGGVSPQPLPVQNGHIERYRRCNLAPSYFMWRKVDQEREPLRERLAQLVHVSNEEIAINRNATEGLNTIIFGLNLSPGDEVVLSPYDYPHMLNAWRQRELRDGLKLNYVQLDLPMEDDDATVERYREAITPKTKVIHITHVINWTGQIMPVKRITEMAKAKGCEVVVDAAHSFIHLPIDLRDIGCDYAATSLHKWLCAPFGTGMMFIRKEKIGKVWPLLGNHEPQSDDIRKFESLGTRSFAAEMAIHDALDFHDTIGQDRRSARFRHLRTYWTDKVRDVKNIRFYTSHEDRFAGGMSTVGIEGWEAEEMVGHLFETRGLHTTPVKWEQVNGVRISPHLYTAKAELDLLVDELTLMAKR